MGTELQLEIQDGLFGCAGQSAKCLFPANVAVVGQQVQIIVAGRNTIRIPQAVIVIEMGHEQPVAEALQEIQLVGIAVIVAGVPAEAHMGLIGIALQQRLQIFFSFQIFKSNPDAPLLRMGYYVIKKAEIQSVCPEGVEQPLPAVDDHGRNAIPGAGIDAAQNGFLNFHRLLGIRRP